jgi:hypothetical protein
VGFTIIGGEIDRSSFLVSFEPAKLLRIVELLWDIVDGIELAIERLFNVNATHGKMGICGS